MKYKSLLFYLSLFATISCTVSCSFEKIGSDLTKGVSTNSRKIGDSLVDGVFARLNRGGEKDSLKNLLSHLIDSMVYNAGLQANEQVKLLKYNALNNIDGKLDSIISRVRESAIGKETRLKVDSLISVALGVKTKLQIAALRDELLGEQTNARLQKIAADFMRSLLDSVPQKVGVVRDTLLSNKTTAMAQTIIDSTLNSFFRRLNPAVDQNLSFIKKYATELLITLALLAAGIIILVWRNRQKYLKAVTLITSNIQKIPDQQIYDELTAKIKNDAVKSGVEPTLRTVLKENGLLGTESWKKAQKINP